MIVNEYKKIINFLEDVVIVFQERTEDEIVEIDMPQGHIDFYNVRFDILSDSQYSEDGIVVAKFYYNEPWDDGMDQYHEFDFPVSMLYDVDAVVEKLRGENSQYVESATRLDIVSTLNRFRVDERLKRVIMNETLLKEFKDIVSMDSGVSVMTEINNLVDNILIDFKKTVDKDF